ncbi:hypothetical protein NTE_03531 [Candidatus Nitrososphaera evergladensis SR1]|uniref:Uncharacterized protein n=1 Tax=Candidatus Nitrososphaera evergladensis SR1 TaxID=1459636 RepID=A0A075N290_9ARCH|nr:hypothetical protein [Candidatus Nitrososphaera evergladensis]AIF85559.1 hypothetical protein NTE_03531 [Candidatus Nitrososphaera evergladensis SR1]
MSGGLEDEDTSWEERRDSDLEGIMGQLQITQCQVSRLRRVLANRLDRSNPATAAFSKGSSTYAFRSAGVAYRITIEADLVDDFGKKPILRSVGNKLRSPVFLIMVALFSAILSVIALTGLYWNSPALATLSDKELAMADRQYSVLLDSCTALSHDRPDPRASGAAYSICNKGIAQLQEFCRNHHTRVCEDERIELYTTAKRLL